MSNSPSPKPSYRRPWAVGISTLLLALIWGFVGNASPKADESPCETEAQIPGLNGDASLSIQAVANYSATIYDLFRMNKFKQIDCLADSARSGKELFPGGLWKIHALYTGLSEPPGPNPSEQDWVAHIKLLEAWMSAKPKSITARVALAESYFNYGAAARGRGTADTVSENGWKLFTERNAKARLILEEAATKTGKDPEWYMIMQFVALGQEWDQTVKQALLQDAITFEPNYYYYYRNFAESVLPKWGGEEGETASFLQGASDRIGGDSGDILYFRVAGTLICGCGEYDRDLNLSWPRIKKGFDAVEKQNGPSPENWNLMAHMAVSFQDAPAARKLFDQIGDQWSERIWRDSSSFESGKQWANQQLNP